MRILLAVSGGIDSMYLVHRASDLFPGSSCAVAHCNFGLRGAESDADEQFVRSCCAGEGLHLHVARFDTKDYAARHGISIEMAARELRYGFFASICGGSDDSPEAVAVAHNADDNAETVLLNLIRGCGVNGMCGMSEDSVVNGLRILRPLLGVSRAEITEWMTSRGFKWREDSSNASCEYKRNVLRHKVMPVLKSLNPSLLDTFRHNSEHFRQVGRIADDEFAQFESECVHNGEVALDSLLARDHWEYCLWRLTRDLTGRSQYEDLAEAIRSGAGTFAGKRYGKVLTGAGKIILGFSGGSADCTEVAAHGPGQYVIGGSTVTITTVTLPEGASFKAPAGTIYLKPVFPLVLRRWRDGDWMRPFGMDGKKRKLSDIFSDLKMSVAQKQSQIVVADPSDGSHVLAVCGLRIDISQQMPGSSAESPVELLSVRCD